MERKDAFDPIAEQYDAARPRYQDVLVEKVMERIPPSARLLEVGCGTAIATMWRHMARVVGIGGMPGDSGLL